jgi:hypothetical protein
MYMKQGQLSRIQAAAEEIRRLATMETCGLKDKCGFTDDQMKKIKLWVGWFDIEAEVILKQLER